MPDYVPTGYIQKLLDYIHEAFNKESDQFVALRIRHVSETFAWVVSGRILSLYANGYLLNTIDLTQYTLQSLVSYLATLPNITIVYINTEQQHIAASSIIDGKGFQNESNGDIIYSYKSTLWMYLDALATELSAAKQAIIDMLDQMSVKTADNEWLDEWGGYFGVQREIGEVDANYSNRIIIEVIRPRGNNKAIEAALFQKYGQQTIVSDVVKYGATTYYYDSGQTHNSAIYHDSTPTILYGLFEIVIGYDLLLSGDTPEFIQSVRDFVEKFRDAGTHLDAVNLSSSEINDSFDNPPVDSGINLVIRNGIQHNGLISYNSTRTHDVIFINEII